MRPLTRNEKVLLPVLALIVIGGANYFGYQALAQRQKAVARDYLDVKTDNLDGQHDLEQERTWAERKAWIEAHQPTLGDEGDAKATLLQSVLKGARDNNLEVLDQSLNDVDHSGTAAVVRVNVKVKGSMQGLCKWLAALQQPESFYAVTQFSLKADADQKSMVCTLEVSRFFKPGSS